ncbi:hypothetical protein [Microvirga ossetica]|uniref:hypothetical protein n=1 Tax=Microvirga ossetica TaxID=1882682 RepID=UPI0012FFEFD5|nr:hypothetical protein [Microvirga ossetica]
MIWDIKYTNQIGIVALIISSTLLISFSAYAQNPCNFGSEETVLACDTSVTAQWDEDAEDDCTWNPPPGFVVIEVKKDVWSSNSGSRSVNVIAGNSEFATERQYNYVRRNLTQMAAKYAGVDYSAKIDSEVSTAVQSARRYSATNNTVYATVHGLKNTLCYVAIPTIQTTGYSDWKRKGTNMFE